MKKTLNFILITFFILVLLDCTPTRVQKPNVSEEVKKFGTFAYIKENSDLAMVIDVELAKRRMNENYFPLGIKIANKNLEMMLVDRETLHLVDENGNVYTMPDTLELQKNYDKLAPDHKFKSQTGLLGDQLLTSFTYFQKAESNFFPQTQGAARIIDFVNIQKKGYMEDLIYFPMPAGGIKGKKLKLRLDIFELEQPFEISFSVD